MNIYTKFNNLLSSSICSFITHQSYRDHLHHILNDRMLDKKLMVRRIEWIKLGDLKVLTGRTIYGLEPGKLKEII